MRLRDLLKFQFLEKLRYVTSRGDVKLIIPLALLLQSVLVIIVYLLFKGESLDGVIEGFSVLFLLYCYLCFLLLLTDYSELSEEMRYLSYLPVSFNRFILAKGICNFILFFLLILGIIYPFLLFYRLSLSSILFFSISVFLFLNIPFSLALLFSSLITRYHLFLRKKGRIITYLSFAMLIFMAYEIQVGLFTGLPRAMVFFQGLWTQIYLGNFPVRLLWICSSVLIVYGGAFLFLRGTPLSCDTGEIERKEPGRRRFPNLKCNYIMLKEWQNEGRKRLPFSFLIGIVIPIAIMIQRGGGFGPRLALFPLLIGFWIDMDLMLRDRIDRWVLYLPIRRRYYRKELFFYLLLFKLAALSGVLLLVLLHWSEGLIFYLLGFSGFMLLTSFFAADFYTRECYRKNRIVSILGYILSLTIGGTLFHFLL